MRVFSTNVTAALAEEPMRPYYLFKMTLDQEYRFTSHSSEVTYNGQEYISDGGLISIDAYENNNIVDRSPYRINLSDSQGTFKAALDATSRIGLPIEVRIGFLDSNNVPMTDLADVNLVYKGTIDKPSLRNDWDRIILTIEGSSPLTKLDAVNTVMVSQNGMDQISTTDTSFDGLFDGQEIELKWGKA